MTTCWLHNSADEHPIVLLVGELLANAMVVPAEVKCARQFHIDLVRPATEINSATSCPSCGGRDVVVESGRMVCRECRYPMAVAQ